MPGQGSLPSLLRDNTQSLTPCTTVGTLKMLYFKRVVVCFQKKDLETTSYVDKAERTRKGEFAEDIARYYLENIHRFKTFRSKRVHAE